METRLNSSRKRKQTRGVDEEQSERKLFNKSCSPTSSFLDALGRSFQIPGLTLGTVNKLQFSGKQYFSANALNLLSMGFLEKASLILLANASDTLSLVTTDTACCTRQKQLVVRDRMNSICPMIFFRTTDTTDTTIWKPGFRAKTFIIIENGC